MVATPGDPGNGKFVRELNTPVPVEIAYGGTCTAGKNEDMDMYAQVLADALKQGKRVAESVNSIFSSARRRRATTACGKAISTFSRTLERT